MVETADHQRRRIAVIGSGIGGLTAAWLLKNDNDVTIYEQHAQPGMGVFSVDYSSNGETTKIDIPTRIFCEGYYPQLVTLLKAIGVELQATDHSAAFADETGKVFFHYGQKRLFGRSWDYPKGLSWLRGDGLRISRDSVRLFKQLRVDVARGHGVEGITLAEQTLEAYLETSGLSNAFVDRILLPTLSVMCTCDYQGVLNYPADLILECLNCGVMQEGVMRAEAGVHDVVPRLLTNVEQRCGEGVERVAEVASGIEVQAAGQSHVYDQVILASQAQQAERMLHGFDDYRRQLSTVPFQKSTMVVHTDKNLLPKDSVRLSPVTHHIPRNATWPEASVSMNSAFATYQQQEPVFQTWNPLRTIAKEKILASADFTRPLVTLESRSAIKALRRNTIENNRGVWFCGAYMANKVPLLEAAVDSAIRVARALGAHIPWEA